MPSLIVTRETPPGAFGGQTVIVEPEVLNASPGGGPVIAGVVFRRPTARPVTVETVRSSHELGNGKLRTYVVGRRHVFSLSWSHMTEDEVDALKAATADPFVTYSADSDSPVYTVSTDEGISYDAVPGTYPIRFEVSTTLRERDAFR